MKTKAACPTRAEKKPHGCTVMKMMQFTVTAASQHNPACIFYCIIFQNWSRSAGRKRKLFTV